MNICLITSSYPAHSRDAAQAPFVTGFIEGMQRRGHRVFVFTQDREGEKEEFIKNVKVRWFSWSKSKKPLVRLNPINPFDILKIISLFIHGKRELLLFLRENGIEACLALWVVPGGYFAYYAFRKMNIPYSVWSLGSDVYRYGENPFLYSVMRRIIGKARGVFADGFDLTKRIEERFGRKCFFLATTRSLGKTVPEKPEGLNKSKSPYRFLFIGRIEKVKGIDLLLHAVSSLKKEKENIHLTIVGKGSMEEWAKHFVREEGLEEDISWMENVTDQLLISLYESSDCVVIPSRSESIPLVFSEALGFNKDLIVTDVGDMGMLGRRHEVASVVPPDNVTALKNMMKDWIGRQSKPGIARDEGKREELKRLFDIETSVERFLADYRVTGE